MSGIQHQRAARAKALDFGLAKTPVGERLRSTFTAARRAACNRPRRTRITWRGRGLSHAVDVNEGAARPVVRVLRRLGEREYRRKTHVRDFHFPAPLIPGLALEGGGESGTQLGPALVLMLSRQRLGIEAESLEQFGVE